MVVALSMRFMDESRDESRTSLVDWSGAALVVIGLGGVVFGLLQWPVAGATDRSVLGALAGGSLTLLLFLVVERRAANPMLPLDLFRSRAFTLANVLTLLLYAPVAVVFFLVPMTLIQVRGYTATAAGSALLPFPLIMFALSRWSGGLVARIGSRLPLTIGPAVSACGIALVAWPGGGASYWTAVFPAAVVLGAGMAVTVAPLTTTVMDAVERQHAGVASGINNAVARVAGLLAVAVFGVVLVEKFDARAKADLVRLALPAAVRTAIDRELPKMAGADVERATAMDPSIAAAVRQAIDDGFVSAFRVVMIAAAAVAMLAAALVAALFRDRSAARSSA
jgi:predicted MFS family arabinose efflux permease